MFSKKRISITNMPSIAPRSTPGAAAAGENDGTRIHDEKSAPPTTRWHYGWWPGEALPSARL